MSTNPSDPNGRANNARVRSTLEEWQRIFLQRDWDALPELLADDVTFHTPADATPLLGKEAFVASLQQSFAMFRNFEYAREFAGDEGHVLEFAGSVGDAAFTGIDIIRLDDAGQITDLVVMIRPMSAMMKPGEEAAR